MTGPSSAPRMARAIRGRPLTAVLIIGTIACGGDQDSAGDQPDDLPSADAEPAAEVAPAAAPDPREVVIDLRDVPWAVPLEVNLDDMILQQSGLYVQVLAEGTGPRATPGDSMDVHYHLWLPNGQTVDASRSHSPPDPLPMVLGVTSLIDGWAQGVMGMRVGERRRLVLPHELGYGPGGRPPIPPYSPLLFEVELMSLVPGDLPEGGPGN
ncbi:MAG: FKBP-type peptidyl-prolyl cis-trans isomerase [Gemmatimonadota bacterium]|nr:FKBP-type peptidyl-prolyl cis-trans isomerase [Gemmatimonadota bacterium]